MQIGTRPYSGLSARPGFDDSPRRRAIQLERSWRGRLSTAFDGLCARVRTIAPKLLDLAVAR